MCVFQQRKKRNLAPAALVGRNPTTSPTPTTPTTYPPHYTVLYNFLATVRGYAVPRGRIYY
eukprot:m.1646500 g.1646500  ORF g.1646500 m.1646500 type:complete len:61 (+) comp71174_c0_seq1:119-301(+)